MGLYPRIINNNNHAKNIQRIAVCLWKRKISNSLCASRQEERNGRVTSCKWLSLIVNSVLSLPAQVLNQPFTGPLILNLSIHAWKQLKLNHSSCLCLLSYSLWQTFSFIECDQKKTRARGLPLPLQWILNTVQETDFIKAATKNIVQY